MPSFLGLKPCLLYLLALAGGFFTISTTWETQMVYLILHLSITYLYFLLDIVYLFSVLSLLRTAWIHFRYNLTNQI